MNIIADRLFALLLGWTGSLFNGLWNMITNNSAGFTGFLQRFWLPLIIILLLAGTIIDYIIWLIRWRPYYVWSSWLRRFIGRRRLVQTQSYMEDLDHSPLDLPEYQEYHQTRDVFYDEPIYFDFEQTNYQEQPAFLEAEPQQEAPIEDVFYQAQPPVPEEPPVFVPHLPWENLCEVPIAHIPHTKDMTYTDLSDWTDPKMVQDTPLQAVQPQQEEAYDPSQLYVAEEQQALAPEAQPSTRRRRVETRRKHSANVLKSIRDTLFTSNDEIEVVNSLEPPILQEAAYHKPYYPQDYAYREQHSPQLPQEQASREHPPQ
ncbi:MAG: hypothetical protein GXZ04_02465 [Clostridiales bacterium]|nr:hypothetical protein [Clostridiales bacterium]